MRSPKPRQLQFVFADSPRGGKGERNADGSAGREYLLQTAKAREASGIGARADDPCHLLEQVASEANLAKALLHVARNKGAPGVDGESTANVVRESRRLLPSLHRSLLEESYVPGDVRRVWIPKPGGGQRGLGIPNVVDRWVQQAVHQILEPIFDPMFHDSSHGFRSGRGASTALTDVRRHLATGHVWLVNIDLSKFFDRVNHQRLLARLAQRVEDKRVLKLVHRFLGASVALPDGVRVPTEEGTPQGGPLSPLLSNVVLDELDWELERRGLRFVRYADDFIVFVRSERAAYRVMDTVTRFIERRLRLKVNRDKSSVTRPDDTHFLGFRFERMPDGSVEVHLSSRSVDRLKSQLKALTPRTWGQSLQSCMDQVGAYARGWMAHFKQLSEAGAQLLSRFDAHVRRRLRAIIIRHKKRDRHLFRDLLARGVNRGAAARTAFCRRGIWFRSYHVGMHQGYPNAWFARRMPLFKSEWFRLQPAPRSASQLLLFE